MLGLMIIIFFVVYLLVSVWVTRKAVSWAKSNNKKPWVWGGLAAFVMYNLVFWDWIPTLVAHKYYCSTQAGFWVYKTPEQWKKENPELSKEALEPLGTYTYEDRLRDFPYKPLINNPQHKVLMLNQRVYLDSEDRRNILGRIPIKIHRWDRFIADVNGNQRLATFTNFSSGYGNPMTAGKGLSAWKFWLGGSCYNSTIDEEKAVGYKDFIRKIINLGE